MSTTEDRAWRRCSKCGAEHIVTDIRATKTCQLCYASLVDINQEAAEQAEEQPDEKADALAQTLPVLIEIRDALKNIEALLGKKYGGT